MLTKAIINGDKILCGKCMNLLAKIKETFYASTVAMSDNKITRNKFGVLEIKCKARKNGINCNEINEIQL